MIKKFTYLVIILIATLSIELISQEAYEGYVLYNPGGSKKTNLLDMDNNIAHQWDCSYSGGYSVYLLENGNILRPATDLGATLKGGAYSGLLQEIDWDGNVVWEFEYNSTKYITHHDIEPMPNGNVLLIAWEVKTAQEAIEAGRTKALEVWPDHIIEVQKTGPKSGDIVWEWHAWDHLIQNFDASKNNYGVISEHPELIDANLSGGAPFKGGDLLHINGISYNPDLDQIALSSHFTNEIYVIDHSTTTEEAAGHSGGARGKGGDILYRWGSPGNYKAVGYEPFDVIHCSVWIADSLPGAGNILVFNNGSSKRESEIFEIVPPIDEHGAYILDKGTAYGPTEAEWIFSNGRDFFSNHLGSCQRLPNGNTFICEATSGYLFETTSGGNVIWEYPYGKEITRAIKYGSDYPGLWRLNNPNKVDPLKTPVIDNTMIIPNPVSDKGYIRFNINREASVVIDIYNALGIKQANILDKTLSPGYYSFPIPKERILPGPCYCNINIEGSFETLPFIIIK